MGKKDENFVVEFLGEVRMKFLVFLEEWVVGKFEFWCVYGG
jgi:hypothetical protein